MYKITLKNSLHILTFFALLSLASPVLQAASLDKKNEVEEQVQAARLQSQEALNQAKLAFSKNLFNQALKYCHAALAPYRDGLTKEDSFTLEVYALAKEAYLKTGNLAGVDHMCIETICLKEKLKDFSLVNAYLDFSHVLGAYGGYPAHAEVAKEWALRIKLQISCWKDDYIKVFAFNKSAIFFFELGCLSFYEKDYEPAIFFCQQAISLKDQLKHNHLMLALIYNKLIQSYIAIENFPEAKDNEYEKKEHQAQLLTKDAYPNGEATWEKYIKKLADLSQSAKRKITIFKNYHEKKVMAQKLKEERHQLLVHGWLRGQGQFLSEDTKSIIYNYALDLWVSEKLPSM